MRNNIIQAVWKVGYADAPFDEDNNLYSGGKLQFTKGLPASSPPEFVDPSGTTCTSRARALRSTAVANLGYAA